MGRPALQKGIEATDRRQLIIGAVTTNICLVSPAISAVEDDYEVQAVLDASGSTFEVGEETSCRRMAARACGPRQPNTMIAALLQDWRSATGQKLMP
jgi:isochorismate hydrolase